MKRIAIQAACLALLLVLLLAPAAPASAFCIYNKSDLKVRVDQISGGKFGHSFTRYIDPGGRACCNWKNKDCNKNGHKDSEVGFGVTSPDIQGQYCLGVKVKAGGWMDIHKDGHHLRCTAHYE